MKKLTIKTLGCKVNQCESEAIRNALLDSCNSRLEEGEGEAEVVVVNTCTVTSKAAMQSRQAVRQAVRAHPGARIVVTGCHAQVAPDELAAIEGVDLVIGNRDKLKLSRQILATLPATAGQVPAVHCTDIFGADGFEVLPRIAPGDRTRPFLKIQDGCDAFCTYCIVPHARGRSRSLPMAQVLDQVAELGRLGYKEIVLTGIHIGCYGKDLTPATTLYELLGRIRQAGSIFRLRVSSIEPMELSDEIIGLAQGGEAHAGRLCRHFHVPLQSGDDGILKRMHRPYTAAQFRRRVEAVARWIPEAAIGVDTLIGFPGESDAAFENTYQLIQSLPVAYLHVFPFSARKGTPAYGFADPVDAATIKDRCQRMRDLGAEKRRAFVQRHLGRQFSVLIEETRDRESGLLKGLTDNYIPVKVEGGDELYNSFQAVKLVAMTADGGVQGVIS